MSRDQNHIRKPRRSEKAALRIMILIGFMAMIYMMKWILQPMHVGFAPLYWLVITTMFYLILRILHEWYHYFFISIPEKPELKPGLKVDVLTTYCEGEPYEMIKETLTAIKNIEYPHESYLCDDAGDPLVKQMCKDLGVNYVSRNERTDAKAGNINNALRQATGEFCVVLDPDHVPQPDFLHKVLPHFENPNVGFVQVVQAYKNKHESLIAKGAAQQTFQFYGPMMMTMNSYGTVQAIGANCTFRRAALDSIGGHAAGLAEDMHTAMKLHAKGWKSVYEPVIVARGLVPSTLSGYYKQQLKWAKGTTDLLINVYPRLFKDFTIRQKLHYGTIPFHYFSGFIFLLNFLIPVLALSFNLIPMKVDLKQLALVATPFMSVVLLIRHFVQRWVMEESERGFHVVGGILHIGTWWINILGVLFTLFRVEVPYDPTPKDGVEGNTLRLNFPNIIIGLVSLAAVIYGLSLDWSPFSLMMALLAMLNVGFMAFMVISGLQHKMKEYAVRRLRFDRTLKRMDKVGRSIWGWRYGLYATFRTAGLPMSILITLVSMFLYNSSPGPQSFDHFKERPFYAGIYLPSEEVHGFSDLNQLQALDERMNDKLNLIPLYLAWDDNPEKQFPKAYLNKIYDQEAFPVITWEPWTRSFEKTSREKGVFDQISEGTYDVFLTEMASNFKALEKPVFLRFAHEADNPQYPWSEEGRVNSESFIEAWKHVYQLFESADANNVIWVWNPWHAESAVEFFPGEAYVDWIGLTLLNYAELNKGKKWKSFDQLYLEYDSTGIFDYDIPVMLAEFGSLERSDRQTKWFVDAIKTIREERPEVKAVVLFNDVSDYNVPLHADASYHVLNWTLRNPELLLTQFSDHLLVKEQVKPRSIKRNYWTSKPTQDITGFEPGLRKGLNFHKGKDWKGNYDELSMRTARKDFDNISELGTEIVKWCGPGIYDRNALMAMKDENLKIMYSFWIPGHLDYEMDIERLKELESDILNTVKAHKSDEQIVAWNLGNGIWQRLTEIYEKPELHFQKMAYLRWVGTLMEQMKEIDPNRPITLDLDLDQNTASDLDFLQAHLQMVSAFGIRIEERDSLLMDEIKDLQVPVFISAVAAKWAGDFEDMLVFVEHYKDQRTANYASLGGLLDINGMFKEEYTVLFNLWNASDKKVESMDFRIVTPARPIHGFQQLKYHAIIKDEVGNWHMAYEEPYADLVYSWYLVRTDRYGNFLKLEWKGNNPSTKLLIPKDYENYRVYLTISDGHKSWCSLSKLNRPYSLDTAIGI